MCSISATAGCEPINHMCLMPASQPSVLRRCTDPPAHWAFHPNILQRLADMLVRLCLALDTFSIVAVLRYNKLFSCAQLASFCCSHYESIIHIRLMHRPIKKEIQLGQISLVCTHQQER